MRRSPPLSSQPKPRLIWLTQSLIGLAIAATAITILGTVIQVIACIGSGDQPQCLSLGHLFDFGLASVFLGLSLLAWRGIQARQARGRWLSIIVLIGIMIAIARQNFYVQIFTAVLTTQGQPLPPPPYGHWVPDGVTESFRGYSSYPDLFLHSGLNLLFCLSPGILAIYLASHPTGKNFFKVSSD